MRKLLSSLVLSAAFALPALAHATNITYTVTNGSLTDGGSVSGSFVVDVTAPGVFTFVSTDLTYVDGSYSITFDGPAGSTFHGYSGNSAQGTSNFTYTILGDPSNGATDFYANTAYLELDSIGTLCTLNAHPCPPGNNASNLIEPNGSVPNISIATVTTAVTPTPEPSSLVLLGTGILTAAGAARRKLRKA